MAFAASFAILQGGVWSLTLRPFLFCAGFLQRPAPQW